MKTEPVPGGKADKDGTEEKQGQPSLVRPGGHGTARSLGGLNAKDILFFQLSFLQGTITFYLLTLPFSWNLQFHDLKQIEAWAHQGCLGRAKLIMTSFFLTSLIPIQVDIVRACVSSESVKTLLLKGKAPVDPECTPKVGKVRDSSTH